VCTSEGLVRGLLANGGFTRSSIVFLILTCGPSLPIGRRIGWSLSKAVLYTRPTALALAICVLWGAGLATLIRLAIDSVHPGMIAKVIGFGAAAYLSIPNYGLFLESQIPLHLYRRHMLVSNLPILIFVAGSIALAYGPVAL
jgi:hypothetical protein